MSTMPTPPYSPYETRMQARLLKQQIRQQLAGERGQRRQYKEALRQQLRSQRTGSILGPILAISLGVIFLLLEVGSIHRDQFQQLFTRFWPLVLIASGAIVLIEWAVDRRRIEAGEPPIRRVIGFWSVLLISTFVGAGLFADLSTHHKELFLNGFAVTPDNIDEFLGERHESDAVPVDMDLPAGAILVVTNPHGNINIKGDSADGKLHLGIHRVVFSRSDDDASDKYSQIDPHFVVSGSQVTLDTRLKEGEQADLTLSLPTGVGVTVTAERGNITLANLHSDAVATANHGNVELSSLGGSSTVHLNSGDSDLTANEVAGALTLNGHAHNISLSDIGGKVTLDGEFFGTTRLEHIDAPLTFHTSRTNLQLARLNGDMTISPDSRMSADGISGPVSITTKNRNITLERVAGNVSVQNSNGSVDVASLLPLGNVTIVNRNGSASVTLPEHAGFSYSADTTDGAILNDFAKQNSAPVSRHNVETGLIGDGAAVINIKSTQGDVTLRRSTLATALPELPVIKLYKAPVAPTTSIVPPTPPVPPITPGARTAGAEQQLQAAQQELTKAINDQVAAAQQSGSEGERARRRAAEELRKASADLKSAAQRVGDAAAQDVRRRVPEPPSTDD